MACVGFAVLQVVAALVPSRVGVPAAAVGVGFLIVGSILCVVAVVLGMAQAGAGRAVDVMGLFLLQGTVPHEVRRLFVILVAGLGLLGAVTATRAPFGLLAAMLPIGAAGVWSGLYGAFPEERSGRPPTTPAS